MRRMTRKQLETEYAHVQRENMVMMLCLTLEPSVKGRHGALSWKLFGPTRCDGGVCSITYHLKGQLDTSVFRYVEDVVDEYHRSISYGISEIEYRDTMSEIIYARNEAIEKEKVAQ